MDPMLDHIHSQSVHRCASNFRDSINTMRAAFHAITPAIADHLEMESIVLMVERQLAALDHLADRMEQEDEHLPEAEYLPETDATVIV
jgi:hypothetical protein